MLIVYSIYRSGMLPVTTCSPHNFRRVKALGAVEAFDYHSPNCGSDVLAYTKNSLEMALDCITDTASMKICYTAIGPNGGRYVALDPFPIRSHTRRSIKPEWVLTFTITGKPVNWQEPFKKDARPQDREFAVRWYQVAQGLLDQGAILTHPIEETPGGLAGIIKGAERGIKGLVSGVKLVYWIPNAA
jgi:aspyridone synthetase trans-acting enoyl reductase